MENSLAISQALEDYRKEAASKFVQEFIEIWQKQGFYVDDLIDGLASYSHEMKLDHQLIILLEDAATRFRSLRMNDQLPKDTKSD